VRTSRVSNGSCTRSNDATLLRQYKNNQQADWLEDRAAEVEAALREQDTALVNLQEAAGISGYSADHLGRQVRNGTLKNYGRPHAPRVRRGDLPRKLLLPGLASRDLVGASRRQVAQAITTSESSRR
jgi:hypothetical protein